MNSALSGGFTNPSTTLVLFGIKREKGEKKKKREKKKCKLFNFLFNNLI